MKKPKRYPIMRSAKQAMYMRQLVMSDIYRISTKSGFSEMQKRLDRLQKLNVFIEARTISENEFISVHNRYSFLIDSNWSKTDSIQNIVVQTGLSVRSVKYLLKQSL